MPGRELTAYPTQRARNGYLALTVLITVTLYEGVVLVATPALMRDFSPQSDRGSAMGFWTLGPVFGALITSAVGTLTIHGTPVASFWGHEYVIAGIAGVVVSAIAIVFLKELSPQLRDLHHANMLANWMWAANAVAVIATGLLSDRLAVRKPFMAVGAVITGTGIVVYLEHFTHHASFGVTAVMAATITFGLGVAFTPWLANFTETVEAHNPALAATGLATWGLTLRVVTFFASGCCPSSSAA